MGRPLHAHWNLWFLQPVLAPIQAGHQTLEVNLFKAASTRDTIPKGGDVTTAEHMESIKPKVTGTVKERNLSGPTLSRPDPYRRFYIKTYWSKDGMGSVLLQAYISEEAIKS